VDISLFEDRLDDLLDRLQNIGKGEDQECLEDQERLANFKYLKSELVRPVLVPEGSGDHLFAH